MPLKLRGTKYHYRFQIDGHKYSGICPGCEVVPGMSVRAIRDVERRAAQYESEAKERAQQELQAVAQADAEVRRNRTVRALVENYRYELTGGKPIRINEAYDLAAAKPAKRVACARYLTSRASAWRDFSDFMAGEYPDVEMLADVRRAHCEAFVQFLVQFGRYNKTVTYSAKAGRKKGVTSYERNYLLSAKTIRDIAQVCRWVFSRLDMSGIDGLTEEQLISPSLTFQIQGTDVNVAAQYKEVIPTENITVQNAAINDIPVNDNGDGTFTATVEKGTNVTVTANDAPEGMEFDRWNVSGIDGLTEEQLISTSLTFQIQDTDVNVAAQYKAVIPTETITVQNATIENSENIPVNNNDDGTVSATVNSGTTVVLSANEAPEGMEFDRWDVTSQEEVNTYSRTEPTLEVVLGAADVKVEPVYTAAAAFPTVTYSEPSGGTIAEKKDEYEENGKKYRKYTYTLTPSEGYQIDSFTAKKGDADADNLKVSDDRTTLTFTTGEEEGTVTVTVAASLSKTYKLTVNAGSGSGSYKAGSAVTITADAPQTGWRFTKWTVSGNGTIGSETESTTTFTMAESDATVTANYEKVAHTLTVNSGSGTGAYNFGDQVTITADVPAPGWRFTKWTVSGNGTIASETESPTVFTMADTDVSVSANYEQIPYTLTVSSGSGTGTYVSGDQVVITADPPQTGYRFKNWTLTSGDGAIISPSSSQTTFAMGASDAFVSANYELIPYTLTVKKGSGSGTYTMGTSTQVTPNFPASGKEFDRWEKTSGKISFDSTEKYYATVTMKASDATITALYKDGPNPNDNTITGLADGAEYLKSTTLTFTAAGAGMDNNNPNPGDYRYRPAGYQIGSVGGSWTSSPYTTSMAINAVGDYTLTVTYAKDVYDGNSWNPDGTSVTKSITFHVVNALSVQTGDSSPIIPLAIAGGAALAVIIILVVILRRRGRN